MKKGSLKSSFLEVLPKRDSLSWQRLDRRLEGGIPFLWHHHPEMELTLTLNCKGQRFIGDHVAPFEDGDLALVGSNLPHSWVSAERLNEAEPFNARVIWFHRRWLEGLGHSAAELASLKSLSDQAQRGLSFSLKTRLLARPLIADLFTLPPQVGFTKLLDLLLLLAGDEASVLASQAVMDSTSSGYKRIDRVLHHLHASYSGLNRLEELADIAALSPSGLHRMFRKHMRTTISEYLTNLRIGEACARLAASDTPIAIISHDVGYESQANFNRHFLRLRGMTPRDYRNGFRHS